jgi:hypothetical protein
VSAWCAHTWTVLQVAICAAEPGTLASVRVRLSGSWHRPSLAAAQSSAKALTRLSRQPGSLTTRVAIIAVGDPGEHLTGYRCSHGLGGRRSKGALARHQGPET